ncbi:protein of unknown function [Cupriavidus taiwanensis]|uniref:Uncharacterized protein n=1 Tax=Cupriavidus taiwanensis TaxID=164546 RepID=A0A375IJA2_9BURK|nr:protein of unknown function [Cupriavidus taiwanensis]
MRQATLAAAIGVARYTPTRRLQKAADGLETLSGGRGTRGVLNGLEALQGSNELRCTMVHVQVGATASTVQRYSAHACTICRRAKPASAACAYTASIDLAAVFTSPVYTPPHGQTESLSQTCGLRLSPFG